MKFWPLICLFSITVLQLSAQSVDGFVKDTKTKEALSFVNVGIIGKSIGTVTDDHGHFSLNIGTVTTDTLKISMVGYEPIKIAVNDFIKKQPTDKIYFLNPSTKQLSEVKIKGNKLKEAVLGNTTQSKSTDAGFSSNKLGNEIGEIIKIKKSPTWLKRFNASLVVGPTDSVKLRLNFYTVKDGLPDQLIQTQNIFVTVKKGDEQIEVDLKPYNIYVDDKFFVSLEWIKDTGGHGIMFSASLFGSAIISRETSQANWEKIGIAGVGFNVLAAY